MCVGEHPVCAVCRHACSWVGVGTALPTPCAVGDWSSFLGDLSPPSRLRLLNLDRFLSPWLEPGEVGRQVKTVKGVLCCA